MTFKEMMNEIENGQVKDTDTLVQLKPTQELVRQIRFYMDTMLTQFPEDKDLLEMVEVTQSAMLDQEIEFVMQEQQDMLDEMEVVSGLTYDECKGY
ncbi:MAG: hypothetical protein KAH01_04860 [Caldisericia bacterium]|nr:hypothetical protein [Caldisericia bacterium]